MIELFFMCLQKKMNMSDYGIKIGHGVHNSFFMTSKTILCQAVLTANGGLKDAHFMRYVAFKLNLATGLSYGAMLCQCICLC